jgi:hypothetical protein
MRIHAFKMTFLYIVIPNEVGISLIKMELIINNYI